MFSILDDALVGQPPCKEDLIKTETKTWTEMVKEVE